MILLKNAPECHPERSEGSQVLENTRFFALLRMTDRLDRGFFSGIALWHRRLGSRTRSTIKYDDLTLITSVRFF